MIVSKKFVSEGPISRESSSMIFSRPDCIRNAPFDVMYSILLCNFSYIVKIFYSKILQFLKVF